MKLNYLDSSNLENYRGVEKVEVKFNSVNCIIGANGAGKTRYLDLIIEKLKSKSYNDIIQGYITDINININIPKNININILNTLLTNGLKNIHIGTNVNNTSTYNYAKSIMNNIKNICNNSLTIFIDNSHNNKSNIFSNYFETTNVTELGKANLLNIGKYSLLNLDDTLNTDSFKFIAEFVKKVIAKEREKDFPIKGIKLKKT